MVFFRNYTHFRNISPFSGNSIKIGLKPLIHPSIFQLKTVNGSSAVFSRFSLIFSTSPRIYPLVLPNIPNIERDHDNYCRRPLACIFLHAKACFLHFFHHTIKFTTSLTMVSRSSGLLSAMSSVRATRAPSLKILEPSTR